MPGKNLILLLDGTLDSVLAADGSRGISNVYNINLLLNDLDRDGKEQVAFYFSGVGSQNRWKLKNKDGTQRRDVIDTLRSYYYGATAEGIEQQIADCYVNLCANYAPGDSIFIFGFSRGAVAAKVISDLIGRLGVLRPEKMAYFSEFWLRFRDPPRPGERTWAANHAHGNVEIAFLGLFDCVSGYLSGRQRDIRSSALNAELHPGVKRCVHLLSIDERRKLFSPLVFQSRENGSLAQVWMPGAHGDIGGTSLDSTLGLVSLVTMVWHLRRETRLSVNRRALRAKLASLESQIGSCPKINNMTSFLWSLGGLSDRELPAESEHHYAHPAFFHLYDLRVRFGDRAAIYGDETKAPFRRLSVMGQHRRIWKALDKNSAPFTFEEAVDEPVFVPGPYEAMCLGGSPRSGERRLAAA